MNRKAVFQSSLVVGTVLALVGADTSNGQNASKADSRADSSLATFVDRSANPCVNFYQYACGNFMKLHPIPPDRPNFGAFELISEPNEDLLHRALEKAASSSERTPNQQKIGDYYASCMNEQAIEDRGLAPLQPELDRIAALTEKEELPGLLAHFQLIGVGAFLNFYPMQDFKDATTQIAVIDQGGLGMPERDYYLRADKTDEQLRVQYIRHVAATLKLLGERDTQAQAEAVKIMGLETALARASLDVTSQRDPNNVYHMMRTTEVAKIAPNLSLDAIIVNTGAPPVAELNIASPSFFKTLSDLIASTDLNTLKAYLRWQFIASTPGLFLPRAFDKEDFGFNRRDLRGQREQRPRWKRCVEATDSALGEALGQAYVAAAFSRTSKAATLDMVRTIESAMDQDLDSLDWMTPETKRRAREKLHLIANKIGYPDKWRDYSRLNVVAGDALGNYFRATEFESRRQLAKIGQPVDRSEFFMTPPTVNAYYAASTNDVNFPAGILQPPFYDPTASIAINYGAIGSIIGHEITHGFDDTGRQFDGKGNLADWWTKSDADKYKERAQCEQAEYSKFVVDGNAHVNGKLTLGENIADNGGLRLAYLAFLAVAEHEHVEIHHKKDLYTPAQEFFLAYAQTKCNHVRPQQERLQVETNPHAPNEFRVNGVVQNLSEFGQAFGCKVGQPMMPLNACRVW